MKKKSTKLFVASVSTLFFHFHSIIIECVYVCTYSCTDLINFSDSFIWKMDKYLYEYVQTYAHTHEPKINFQTFDVGCLWLIQCIHTLEHYYCGQKYFSKQKKNKYLRPKVSFFYEGEQYIFCFIYFSFKFWIPKHIHFHVESRLNKLKNWKLFNYLQNNLHFTVIVVVYILQYNYFVVKYDTV